MSLPSVKFAAFIALLAIAVLMDARERRLPNRLTLAGGAMGLILGAALEGGWPVTALGGVALGLVVGFPLFALGAIGAGDAKLLAAVGAFLGPSSVLAATLYGGIAGGVLVLLVSLRRGTLLPVLGRTWSFMIHLVTMGRHGERRALGMPGAATVPYGVAIAAGALAAWFFPGLPGGAL